MESTELAVKNEAALAVASSMMDETPVAAHDIVIPKLLLMQPVSKLVAEKKAQAGQIVNSLEGRVMGDEESPVEFIPYKVVKTWVRFLDTGRGKPKFISQEPITAENAVRPREEEIDGELYKNFETINYYCLLPSELESGEFLPYVISFRSTSYKAGKSLESFRAKYQDYGKPICVKTFKLGSQQEENDQGRYYTFSIEVGRDTTAEELTQVKPWFDRVQAGAVKVDESEYESDTEEETVTASARPTESTRKF